ncbi:Diacetylchitobiose uptake system permease protein NgcF [subsurface metagenome]|nr:ABC transporter permease subunit [Clostridia bacterium]
MSINSIKILKRRIVKSFAIGSFITPAFLIYTIFVFGPMLGAFYLSMFSWNGISPMTFIGVDNYRSLLIDERFWDAFTNNVIWMVFVTIIPTSIGLFLASLISRSINKGKTFFRVVLFLPQVLSSVVIAVIWRWIYHPDFGIVNIFLESIGLGFLARGWLGSSTWALPAMLVAFSWFHYGFCMVVFIAAIQGIDEPLYDAAKVDGASSLQEFRYITVPLIRYAITIVLIITVIVSFRIFDFAFLLTRGGPGYSSMVIALMMYNNAFRYGRVGYASAMAVFLAVFIFVITIILLRLRTRSKA